MEAYNRDQTNTLDAVKNFEIIINEYPKSKYFKKAKEYLKECKIHLAQNLFYIGKYYFKLHTHQSTILRMTELLDTYPDFKFNDEAFFLIGESYYNEENYEKAAKVYSDFIHKYPKSVFRSQAHKRLKELKKAR
jgi:outer membrane protein assembly factor BamD